MKINRGSLRNVFMLIFAFYMSFSSYAQEKTLGAGSYEVYLGSAFHIRQLMDSAQWSYVANTGDGIFWHPVGYQNTAGYDNITPDEWKVLATYFKSKNCLVEGDMINGATNGDVPAINRTKGLGFDPNMAFVNRIQDTAVNNWPVRVSTNLKYDVLTSTMIAPHVMEKYPNGFYDILNEPKRNFILQSYGSSVDAPTYLFVTHAEAYRKSVYDAIDFCHKNGKKFLFLISPNASGANFLKDAITVVHSLEDNDRIPDYYGVEIYGLSWGINLTPETIVDTQNGLTVNANTVSGVARWLLKHGRADEGELDLWVQSPNGSLEGKNVVAQSVDSISPINATNWTGSNGVFTFSVSLTNRSREIDFIPVLSAKMNGLPSGWTAKYVYNGIDITNDIAGSGYLFYKNERLTPLTEKKITVTLTKTGETKLPSTFDLTFEVSPQPNSRFVRDVLHIKCNTTIWDFTSDLEGWNTPKNLTMSVANGINAIQLQGLDANVLSPNNINIDASTHKYVVISMQNISAATSAELFWTTTLDPSLNGAKRVGFSIVPNDTKQRYYIVDVSANVNWKGVVKQLRLDPSTASAGTVKVDFIKLSNSFLPTIPLLPGIVQVENYNLGGQGNGYSDETPFQNSGNQYRTSEGVDLSLDSQQSGNYVVGWINDGEWLDYFVNIEAATNYVVSARVSSPVSTGSISFELDGEVITPDIQVPSTGGYNTFKDITATTIGLPMGIHILRMHAKSAGFNIDKITFLKANQSPTGITLSSSASNENMVTGSLVGAFSTTDPDTGNSFVYTLPSGVADNLSFTIVGNELRSNAVLNYEAKSSYSIKVRTTDQGGLYFEKAFTVVVNDLNDTPKITKFQLIKGGTSTPIIGYDPMNDGAVIDLSKLSETQFNLFAIPSYGADSLVYQYNLNGEIGKQNDVLAPFALKGDGVNYKGWQLTPGSYSITANLYLLGAKTDTRTIAFSVKDVTTSFAVNDGSDGFRIYPNPANSIVTIENLSMQELPYSVSLYNVASDKVFERMVESKTYIIDLSDLISGIYVLNISNSIISKNTKLIIRK